MSKYAILIDESDFFQLAPSLCDFSSVKIFNLDSDISIVKVIKLKS